VLLITPPPIWEEALKKANVQKGKLIALDRTNAKTMEYAQACVTAGSSLGVPVVNAWAGLGGSGTDREQYLLDGLHLNAR
jgi:lysophospholipase L1-like esterase